MATYSRTQYLTMPSVPTITADDDVLSPVQSLIMPTIPTLSMIPTVLNAENIGGAILHDDNVGDTDYTTQANEDTANDVSLLPAAPALNDGFYFGGATKGSRILINIGTAGAGTWTISWYYWNGSTWSALSAYILWQATQFVAFRVAGWGSMVINPPSDWQPSTIGGLTCYFLFAKVTSWTSKTVVPLATRIHFAPEILPPNYNVIRFGTNF